MPSDMVSAAHEATLRRLQETYPGWRIWRSRDHYGRPAAWLASNCGVPGAAPTLHGDTAEKLEAQLQSPPRAV
ncbi:hypothetical protein [Marinactinospora rubrisoli]|uniref:Uncharacterized protein n=1 Tax=Marinactinospora rubrisoli TaxID=2715399 RepID=A0ABW2KLX7_9ACTN